LFSQCRKAEPLSEVDENEWFSGGKQTVFNTGVGAFGSAFPVMDGFKQSVHDVGDAAFEAMFVASPAVLNGGLGPVYNSNSCVSCHVGDGRGRPPFDGEPLQSMLFRISLPGSGPHGEPNPIPGYGGQLQQFANYNVPYEANVEITYTYQTYNFADGNSYELRIPHYSFNNYYSNWPGDALYSPRVAPAVFGLGLLEAIPEENIRARADESDYDSDGISGKANDVWDVLKEAYSLGRFGWKAGQPTVLQQSAGAYNEDMGVTNFIFPKESSFDQPQHDNLDDDTELTDSLLHAVALYVRTLAVPGRRDADDAVVLHGKNIFYQAGCNNCHTPMQRTEVNVAFPEISNQVIFPYTDMLLHDMGDGLADYRPEFKADGKDWRTSPLWGIGLTKVVNGHTFFLHDGRARNLMEAVMWHGGEAESSKEYVRNISASEREALIKFLESL
jgi:CxxC motif-containing protein (DUF1111 family)